MTLWELSAALAQQAYSAAWMVETPILLLQEGTARTEAFRQSEYASKDNFEKTLKDLEEKTTEDDLTIITYSGHGIEETGNS